MFGVGVRVLHLTLTVLAVLAWWWIIGQYDNRIGAVLSLWCYYTAAVLLLYCFYTVSIPLLYSLYTAAIAYSSYAFLGLGVG